MATIVLSTFQAAAGKLIEAQSILKEGLEIVTGLGAKGRVGSLVRGGVPNTLNISLEYADIEEYGAAIDRLNESETMQLFLKRAQESQVLIPLASTDYNELPGMELPFEEIAGAGVVMATVFKVKNGMQQKSIERIARSKALNEKHGVKVRFLQSITGEPFGVTVQVSYYENFEAWGKSAKAIQSDPEWQAYVAEIQGVDASSEFLRTALVRLLD